VKRAWSCFNRSVLGSGQYERECSLVHFCLMQSWAGVRLAGALVAGVLAVGRMICVPNGEEHFWEVQMCQSATNRLEFRC
jgi:hypothetical protein